MDNGMGAIRKGREDYTVGWVSALPLEMAVAIAMLDERHGPLQSVAEDDNVYELGQISGHNVVIACLPSGVYGTTSAAAVASNMLRSFPKIMYGLMVGIAGGALREGVDIRLGDVVVGHPTGTEGGVVQYDFGKILSGGQVQRTGMLNKPPPRLLTAVANLRAKHASGENKVQKFMQDMLDRHPDMTKFNHPPGPEKDKLFKSTYVHRAAEATCATCKEEELVARTERPECTIHPVAIHYGLVASGYRVIKDGLTRDRLARELGVLCFEMEAAGLVDHFPSLTIRGICDYCDSHKNKEWQEYAATAAAAYAKDLLCVVPKQVHDNRSVFKVAFDLGNVPVINEFKGRKDELEKLWVLLRPRVPNMRKVVVLNGLGGIGKTQLAIRFARMRKDDYTSIFWLNAKNRETLIYSLATTVRPTCPGLQVKDPPGNDEEMKERALDAQRWLAAEGNSKWLLVLDSVEEQDSGYNVQDFFPRADHGSIIITTRISHLRRLGSEFRVGKLGNEDALQLLTGNSELVNGRKDLLELSRRLDGLPLAIILARSYMKETGTGPLDYLEVYSRSWHDLQVKTGMEHDNYSGGNLITTWKISLDEIQQKQPAAANLFLLLSCFDCHDIWYELIKNGLRGEDDITPPSWLSTVASNSFEFAQCMRELLRFSMVESDESESRYFLHPVVQDWCQDYYMVSRHRDTLILLSSIALLSVGFSAPSNNDASTWALQKRLIPHADWLLRLFDSKSISGLPVSLTLLTATRRVGNLYLYHGRFLEAERMYKRALDGYSALGMDDGSALNVLDNLGLVYAEQGKFFEAEDIHFRVLRERERTIGVDDPATFATVHHLGALYAGQGKFKEAEAKFQQALHGRKEKLGVAHASTLDTMNSLGNVYLDLGNLSMAEELYEQVLAGYKYCGLDQAYSITDTVNNIGLLYLKQGKFAEAEKKHLQIFGDLETLAPDHPAIFNAIDNLGLLYSNMGKFEEAEQKLLHSLTGRQQTLGHNHASVFKTMDMLATVYWMQGRLVEAESVYIKASEGAKELSGLNHILTLGIVNNLGNLYFTVGKYGSAEECFLQAKNGYERVLGANNTSTLDVVANLGTVYRAQGKYKEAEYMYARAEDGYKAASCPTHTSTIEMMNNRGIFYFEQGKLQEAETTFRQATTDTQRLLGRDHPSTFEAINNLGFILTQQGKFAEADEQLSAAWEGRKRTVGPAHQFTLDTLNNLGCLRRLQGRFTEAEEMHRESLEGLTKLLGPDHTLVLEAIHNLGVLYFHEGKLPVAARRCREALAGMEEALGPSHSSTLETLLWLANVLRDQGDTEEARQRYTRVINTLQESLGPGHPSVSRALGDYARLFFQEGHLAEAEALYARALRGLERSIGSQHIYTIRIEAQMAQVHEQRGDLKTAKAMYLRVYETYRRVLGPDHREAMEVASKLDTVASRISKREHRQLVILASLPVLIGAAIYFGQIMRKH